MDTTREKLLASKNTMQELTKQMQSSICDYPEAELLMRELAKQLEMAKGKKSYGCLPKKQKVGR